MIASSAVRCNLLNNLEKDQDMPEPLPLKNNFGGYNGYSDHEDFPQSHSKSLRSYRLKQLKPID